MEMAQLWKAKITKNVGSTPSLLSPIFNGRGDHHKVKRDKFDAHCRLQVVLSN